MIFDIYTAREILRIDGNDNDEIIMPLVEAIPPFLAHTTGYQPVNGNYSPLAITSAKFILQQWYYGENSDTDKLQRVIDCLLKALSAERVIND